MNRSGVPSQSILRIGIALGVDKTSAIPHRDGFVTHSRMVTLSGFVLVK